MFMPVSKQAIVRLIEILPADCHVVLMPADNTSHNRFFVNKKNVIVSCSLPHTKTIVLYPKFKLIVFHDCMQYIASCYHAF